MLESRDTDGQSDTGAGSTEHIDDTPVPKKEITERQAEARRRNGAKSRGPKTDAGKARSSRNAVRHGLFTAVISPISFGPLREDPDEFSAFHAAITEELNPETPLEKVRAEDIASLAWRGRRLRRWEAEGLSEVRFDGFVGDAGDTVAAQARELRQGATVLRRLDDGDVTVDELRQVGWALSYNLGDTPVPGWADGGEGPATAEGWRQVIETMLKLGGWETIDAAVAWVEAEAAGRETLAQERATAAYPSAARSAVLDGFFEKVVRYDAPLAKRFSRALDEYRELKDRNQSDEHLHDVEGLGS